MWLLVAIIIIIAAFSLPAFREIFFSARGWKRVWIFVSGVYLLLVIFVAVSIFRSQNIIEYIIETILWWIIPVAALYGFGYAVGWVLRGFKNQ